MTGSTPWLLGTHLAATAAMTGLIWFVQVVHYPLFAGVAEDRFAAYQAEHMRRTSWVVGPLMGVEGILALVAAAVLRDEVGVALVAIGLVLLAVIHASTVLLQVPAHARLAQGFDAPTHRRLVRTNWIRTLGWSLRAVVAAGMVVVAS